MKYLILYFKMWNYNQFFSLESWFSKIKNIHLECKI